MGWIKQERRKQLGNDKAQQNAEENRDERSGQKGEYSGKCLMRDDQQCECTGRYQDHAQRIALIDASDVIEGMIKGNDVEKLFRPEFRLIVSDHNRYLFEYKQNSYCRKHPLDHRGRDELGEAPQSG